MARVCDICGKGKRVGHTRKLLRGHKNITALRTFKPNLQQTTLDGKKILACTQCLRTATKAGK